MTLRLSSLRAMFIHRRKGRLAAAAALALALTGAGLGNALAAPDSTASAPDAASVSYAAGSQYTVKPGQSLNDVAIAVTQSHDKATLARASHALFDANPNAFMSHDPSRMRVGAALTVPALDATGALAASASSAASASGAATATTGATQANAAASSAASAVTPATVSGTASATTEASSPAQAGAAASGAISSAPAAGSQPAAVSASDTRAWSGSVQPSASEPVAATQPPATAAAPVSAAPLPASQPKVSSLQQLLALKNRVLMELQKHGIGGAPAAGGAVATSGVASAAGASAATPVVPGHGAATAPTSNIGGMSQQNLSIAAAIGAALVVLLTALRIRRRKRENVAAAQAAAADREVAAREGESPAIVATPDETSVSDASDDKDAAVISAAALAAAEREAAEGEAAQRETAEREAAEREAEARHAASQAAAERAATEQAAAEQAAAERATAERVAAEQAAADHARAQQAEHEAKQVAEHEATNHPSQADALSQEANLAASSNVWEESRATTPASAEPVSGLNPTTPPPVDLDFSPEPLPEHHHDHIDGATTAASLAAAAELGAEALPLTALEPIDEPIQQEELARRLQWNDEPAPGASAEQQELSAEPQNNQNVPPPVIDFPQQHAEPHAIVPPGQPFNDANHADADEASDVPVPSVPTMSIPPVPTEFPADAIDAFSSLDMPLPPRIESTADDIRAPVSLTTQPVVSPETTAQQAFAPREDDAPHIADEIAAGTAGPAAVAGLGAAGFGALKLDFDLELPPSPAQPWPAFTPTDLIRIARNKLDLASEYIELGDLSGARTLINEVIEANDPATRTEARALLSTLAPLS
ncbi:FimV C-terminal domain-containing protein [Paraburkholderia fungorum]|uniref:FimV C-terminal domain-containing protein n=1 Tax=Paraburkholderia fungorum TaxID=134537 RepID=A0A1H1GVR3_9BURK|nr:FimV/HubP family polar landmark protein [Paraburkholderia fungorum]SDR17315.1 FimV C-terminal domain-containing protein [Paraburkholderia fungorum]